MNSQQSGQGFFSGEILFADSTDIVREKICGQDSRLEELLSYIWTLPKALYIIEKLDRMGLRGESLSKVYRGSPKEFVQNLIDESAEFIESYLPIYREIYVYKVGNS